MAAFDDVDRKIDDGVEVADEPFYFNCCSAGMEDDPELDLACTSFTNASSDCTAVSVSDVSDAEKDDHQSFDSKSIGGWNKVDNLAAALLENEGLSMSNKEVEKIVGLYQDLSDYEKKPLEYSRNFKPSHDRFGRSKTGHVGLEAIKRCFISAGSPSLSPAKSRLVEAICLRLCNAITSAQNHPYVSRFALIIRRYNEVRTKIMKSPVSEKTKMVLYQINETTLSLW